MIDLFAKVLVIDPQNDVRVMVRSALKELGAQKIELADSVKTAWQLLDSGTTFPSWIITYWDESDRYNSMQLLAAILNHEECSSCRVSLMLSANERKVLPAAFELGLLSFHMKPFTSMSIKSNLENLISSMERDKSRHYMVALEYLASYLEEKEEYQTLVEIYSTILSRYPQNVELYLKLSETQYLAGDSESAKKTLAQAIYLGTPKLELGIKQLKTLVAPDGMETMSYADAFGFHKILIVEPDETYASHVETALGNLGIEAFVTVANGQQAIEYMEKSGPPDLILTEWKLRGMSAPVFFQRVRQMGHVALPVIVVSDIVAENSGIAMREIGISAVIKKPVVAERLRAEVIAIMKAVRTEKNYHDNERQIRQLIDVGRLDEATSIFKTMANDGSVPLDLKYMVEAEILYAKGDYVKAKALAMDVFRMKGESIMALNLLGKIFLKLNDSVSAVKCYNRAQEMNPCNVLRLCELAEAQLESGDIDSAMEAIENAKILDQDNERVKQSEASLKISLGEDATSIVAGMSNIAPLIAYMNNRAVVLVNKGELDEAFDLYKNALRCIQNQSSKEYGALVYNMGLAYARTNKLAECQSMMKKITPEHGGVYRKSVNLLAKVNRAIESSTKIDFENAVCTEQAIDLGSDGFRKPIALHATVGSMCLHLLYDSGDLFSEEIKRLLIEDLQLRAKRQDERNIA